MSFMLPGRHTSKKRKSGTERSQRDIKMEIQEGITSILRFCFCLEDVIGSLSVAVAEYTAICSICHTEITLLYPSNLPSYPAVSCTKSSLQ